MKHTLVVYASRYGYTRRYAQWIAEQLGCCAVEARQVRAEQLAACEVLVYGGGLYAGGLNGAKKILADPCALAGKELVCSPAAWPTRPTNPPGSISGPGLPKPCRNR